MVAMSSLDLQTAVRQEEQRLRLLHPTPEDVPGCVSLLDTFLLCHVVGNQVRSLYRYGHASECSEKLDDFKFCMSMNRLHPEQKRELWIRRRAEWWARRRLTKSSEDVWELRTEPLVNYPPTSYDSVQTASTNDTVR